MTIAQNRKSTVLSKLSRSNQHGIINIGWNNSQFWVGTTNLKIKNCLNTLNLKIEQFDKFLFISILIMSQNIKFNIYMAKTCHINDND